MRTIARWMQRARRALRRPRRWRRAGAASETVTHGTWILVAGALGVLTVGVIVVPGSPVHAWIRRWFPPTGGTIPPGTVATFSSGVVNPSGALACSHPAWWWGTLGIVTLHFPQPEALRGIAFGTSGDWETATGTVYGATAAGWSAVPLVTISIPPDSSQYGALPVAAYQAIRVKVNQPVPDVQIYCIRVFYAPLLP